MTINFKSSQFQDGDFKDDDFFLVTTKEKFKSIKYKADKVCLILKSPCIQVSHIS